jgi:putative nucleotidyltransferase with HDIG domain
LIYLFEKIFKLVSNTKLTELCDTSNKLLRMLADKAPGTFQHSLQVMNLSDAAARSIGANVLLIRAGALYHDIGKIANPQCFTENETSGVRYHAGLSPKESAQEIIRHVSDGLALAEKHGLPSMIKEFIATHHGTTSTGYFLTQYLNDGGNPDDVAEFQYDGVRPTTKEQVILMICDAVEAASRSLKDYSPKSISDLVDRIVDAKAKENQLTDADISLREINTVKEVIKTYLQHVYHSRISYPKRRENRKK